MAYTVGITKIFIATHNARDLTHAMTMAKSCGYDALCFNGDIYITSDKLGKERNVWVKTSFRLVDFTF